MRKVYEQVLVDTGNVSLVNRSEKHVIYLPTSVWIIFTIVDISIMLGAIVGNSMILRIYIKFKNIRKMPNALLVWLAVADLLVACLSLPTNIIRLYIPKIVGRVIAKQMFTKAACRFIMPLVLYPNMVARVCFLAMAIDRAGAVLFPHRYNFAMKNKWQHFMMAGFWTLQLVFITTLMIRPSKLTEAIFAKKMICSAAQIIERTVLTVIHHLNFGIIFTSYLIYACIFVRLRKHKAQIAVSFPMNQANALREKKFTKSAVISLTVFSVCCLPLYIIKTILFATAPGHFESLSLKVIDNVFLEIYYLGTVINPIVSIRSFKDFRVGFQKLCS